MTANELPSPRARTRPAAPVAIAALLATLAGCGGHDGARRPADAGPQVAAAPRPPPDAADPASPACRARVDRLAAALAPRADQEQLVSVPAGLTPPVTTAGRPFDQGGPIIQIDRRGRASYQGKPVTPSAALTRALDEELAHLAERREMMPPARRARLPARLPLYVLADARASLGAVEAIVARVPPSFDLRLVVVGPTPVLPAYGAAWRARPSVKAFFDGLAERGDAPDRAVFVAKQIRRSIGLCAPLIRAFGQVAGEPGESKGQYMAREAPRALAACDCAVADPDLLEAGLLGVFDAFDPPQGWLPLGRDAGRLPAHATVADLVRARVP